MDEPLDELYFNWLYAQANSLRLKNPNRTYWSLFRQLHNKDFYWLIPNDDNRAEDGKDLRDEFLDQERVDHIPQRWLDRPCSMLELLIGLSRRLAFEAGGEPREWVWEMLDNLELRKYTDAHYDHVEDVWDIDEILNRVIYRTYFVNGSGGLFPLKHAHRDQTEVELWYQMSAYVLER